MIRRTKAAPRKTAAKRRKPPALKPSAESIAVVLTPTSTTTAPAAPPTAPTPAPVRYLGNIAELAGALHPARVRFPGNAAAALSWIAGRLGLRLPNNAGDIARTALDPRGGWRPVDDRPWLSAAEYAESAQRLADRGLLVIAVRNDWETTTQSVAMVAPGGMVPAAPPAPSKKPAGTRTPRRVRTPSPRIEDFSGQAPGSGTPFVAEDWVYRQAPAWRLGT